MEEKGSSGLLERKNELIKRISILKVEIYNIRSQPKHEQDQLRIKRLELKKNDMENEIIYIESQVDKDGA